MSLAGYILHVVHLHDASVAAKSGHPEYTNQKVSFPALKHIGACILAIKLTYDTMCAKSPLFPSFKKECNCI